MMMGQGTEEGLFQRLSTGEYVIDEHAVAEAMISRLVRGELPRSAMLVTGQSSNGSAIGSGETGSSSGARLA
jgi:hypothetical protein